MNDRRHWLLFAVCVLATAAMALAPPIPQDPGYHDFADQRTLFAVPNFWNVVSNLPFLLVAGVSLARLPNFDYPVPGRAFILLSCGVFLVAFGSGYYHWAPSNDSLTWDRLPMTISFMALLSLVITERVSTAWGARLLWPLVSLGVASVVYWHWTEGAGAGDLRPYALVQFLPLLLIPLTLWLYKGSYICERRLWAALGLYALAKLAEHFDREILDILAWISGHSIKHLLAALSVWFVVRAISPGPKPG